MTQLVEFSVGEGTDTVVVFEVDAAEVPDDLVLAARDGSTVAGRARVSLEQALDQVRPALERVAVVAQSLSPTETTIEFGLKMGGETGVVVAKGTAEASFTLTLTWRKE
ncbi:hypothetical protein F0L17_00305 [Streptomyces sp. TRM43335]|uniref:Trypsin-co-occurring domain-containing protein n=1 Tax=Streptomyces taklimakanensis TaxID=2569853 RepID=A0A6G2B5V6_9ACTN|nr:hypothetical protein [Streptomyces taklimakanensis]